MIQSKRKRAVLGLRASSLAHTWKTPQATPHMASPKARTGREGAKKGIKMAIVIHAMKNIMVGRHPNLSWLYELNARPNSSPTTAEFAKPDCHGAVISFELVPGS